METTNLSVRPELYTTLETLKVQLKAVKKGTEGPLKTHGQFRFNPSTTAPNAVTDIKTSRNLEELIMIHSFLEQKKFGYEESAKKLGLVSFPVFRWQGHSFEDWENDLKIRAAIVSQHTLQAELDRDIKELEKFLSESDRLKMTLDNIQSKYMPK